MRYHNLDVWIEEAADGYRLRASCAEHGEARDECVADRTALEDGERLVATDSAPRDQLVAFGARLYEDMFGAKLHNLDALFNRCRGAAGNDEGVRLRLRIEAPRVATVPWEYVYSRREECFVATSTKTPLVRYLELQQPILELETAFPARMLVVIPAGSGLDVAAERKALEEALKGLDDKVQPVVLDGTVDWQRISDTLLEARYHIFHFIGHGEFRDDEALLRLNASDGSDAWVTHDEVAALFANHPTMKLVVLNSCKGAELSMTKPLVGMAAALVRRGVPAVVAMQYEIGDDEALCFAREFYRSLFRGVEKGRVEVAMSHARSVLAARFPETSAVGIPVLVMRAAEGLLFDLVDAKPWKARLPALGRTIERLRAAHRTHEANVPLLQDDPSALEREQRALARTRARLRASFATAITAVLLVSGLFMLGVFGVLGVEGRANFYALRLASLLDPRVPVDSVAVVAIDMATARALGRQLDTAAKPMEGAWRAEHGAVLDRLAAAGARVVAFDAAFASPDPNDSAFVRAIRAARARGTQVVVGVRQREGDRPAIADAIRDAVTSWGVLCLGAHRAHAQKIQPLVSAPADGRPMRALPSLALAAYAAFRGATTLDFDPGNRQVNLFAADGHVVDRVRVAELDDVAPQRTSVCSILAPGDVVGETFVDRTPLAALRAPGRRVAYQDVRLARDAAVAAPLRGKIVLVGIDTRADADTIGPGADTRAGVELHVDAINALMQGVTLAQLGAAGQYLLILLMGAAGAAIAMSGYPARARAVLLAAALATYLVVAGVAYVRGHLLFNTVYHVLALLVTYSAVRWRKPRWLL